MKNTFSGFITIFNGTKDTMSELKNRSTAISLRNTKKKIYKS